MRKIILSIVSLCICLTSLAQSPYKSRLGRFQVDQTKGCAPFTVTIIDTNLITTGDCTPGKPCEMNYEGKGQQQNLFSYTYTTPGTFKLTVLYQSIGIDDIVIVVDQNVSPTFEIYSCANNRAQVRVKDNNYDQYLIDFTNDGIAEDILPFSNSILAGPHSYGSAGSKTITVRGRDLNSADNCSNSSQNFIAINVLPSTTINTLTAADESNINCCGW